MTTETIVFNGDGSVLLLPEGTLIVPNNSVEETNVNMPIISEIPNSSVVTPIVLLDFVIEDGE
jgi:hypothetical protein